MGHRAWGTTTAGPTAVVVALVGRCGEVTDMHALRVVGGFLLGLVLHGFGVFLALVGVAGLAAGVATLGGGVAACLAAALVGVAYVLPLLGGPGYAAARVGGGGEWMGLTVGLAGAAFWFLLGTALLPEDEGGVMRGRFDIPVFYAVVVGLPSAIGGYLARRQAASEAAAPGSDCAEVAASDARPA